MSRRSAGVVVALAAAWSMSAFAVELSYRWKVGDVHRFVYDDDTSMEMAMPGMGGMGSMMPGMSMPGMEMGKGGLSVRAKVRTTFSEKVLAVRPDGTADIELTLERMDLSMGGTKTAVLSQFPAAARIVRAEVDRKGHARFYQMVTVYVQDEQMYLGVTRLSGSASASRGGATASATASAGGQEVTLVASVNPKTGKVTASASVKAAAEPPPPALRKVQIKQDAQQVEVLPKQILEMMVLPDGDLPEGGRAVMKTPLGEIASTVESLEGGKAKVHLTMAGNEVGVKSAPAAAPAAHSPGEEEEMGEEGDPAMMDGPPSMEGGMVQVPGGGMPTTSSKMDMDARYDFDVALGRLLGISGTMASDMSMGGMGGVKTSTRFDLRRVP